MVRIYSLLIRVMFVLLLIAGTAYQAHAVLEAQDGCLVPYAMYNNTVDTSIGLMSWNNTGAVYWSFMSPDGVQLGHGVITLSALNVSFSLRTEDGNAHPDTTGYVVFTHDDDGTLTTSEDHSVISANAVLLSSEGATFIPVVPLDRIDYTNASINLNNLTGSSIVGLSYGYAAAKVVSTHYWIDPAFGAQTQIIIWCSQTPPESFTGTIFSVSGGSADITFSGDHTVLNVYDLTQGQGVPAGFIDGLLDLNAGGGERFIFSLIKSSVFSAMQTTLGFAKP
jgi:hypothetical protein